MVSVSVLFLCEVCGTEIDPDPTGIFVCDYCGEKHKMSADSCSLERISDSPITTYDDGGRIYRLREIVEHLESSSSALDAAVKEYKDACRLYEAARPRVSQRE